MSGPVTRRRVPPPLRGDHVGEETPTRRPWQRRDREVTEARVTLVEVEVTQGPRPSVTLARRAHRRGVGRVGAVVAVDVRRPTVGEAGPEAEVVPTEVPVGKAQVGAPGVGTTLPVGLGTGVRTRGGPNVG